MAAAVCAGDGAPAVPYVPSTSGVPPGSAPASSTPSCAVSSFASSQRPICALVGTLGNFGVQSKHSRYSAISTYFPEALKALICFILLCKYYLSVSINYSSNSPIAEIAAAVCVAFFFRRSACLWANPGCPAAVNGSIY